MFEYHRSDQKQNNELNSELVRWHDTCYPMNHEKSQSRTNGYDNDPNLLPRILPVKTRRGLDLLSEAEESQSTPTSTEKQADDDKVRWRQPTEVGGYISHREQWL